MQGGSESISGSLTQKNVEVEYSVLTGADGHSMPSYLVHAHEYGQHIKAKVLDCSNIDTLSTEKIIVPEYIQFGVQCK